MVINNSAQLKKAIALLESEEEIKKAILIEQFRDTYEGLKPINLIKNAFSKVRGTPELGNKIIGASVGLGAGALTKKLLLGRSTNIFKKALGIVLEFAVANVVSKNSDGIKRYGMDLIKKLNKKPL